jgi:indolepyruvate ferredoxin oxidoreductase
VRLAEKPSDISAIRVATGECDTLIGGDLVVSAGAKTLGLMATGRTGAVVNSHEIITGEFTRNTDFSIPSDRLEVALQARLRDRLALFDASDLAKRLMGDTIFSNMMIFGAAWQTGLVPLSGAAIRRAIEMNGAAVEKNLQAFEYGRWAVLNRDRVDEILQERVVHLPATLEDRIAFRAAHLTDYQGKRLAKRYRRAVDSIEDPALKAAVAEGYHKLLSYKDEYEVARLLLQSEAKAKAEFEGDLTLTYHLAPPLLSKPGPDGRPQKRGFRSVWMFKLLAKFKALRGTPLDPFGYTAERRMERALIRDYEADLPRMRAAQNTQAAVALAELPLDIKGFGPVKEANAAAAAKRRDALRAALDQPPTAKMAAE